MPFDDPSLNRRLKPAYPLMAVALLYAVSMVIPDALLPLVAGRALETLLQMAFMAITAGLFMVFPMLFPVSSIAGQLFRCAVIGIVALVFGRAAVHINGLWGLVSFAFLLVAVFGPLKTAAHRTTASTGYLMMEAFVRWLVAVVAMVVLMGAAGLGGGTFSWHPQGGVGGVGFLYFTLLSLAEINLYPWIRRAGTPEV